MDPTSVSANKLEEWARQMGYRQHADSAPSRSLFMSACNTPARRQLWDAIINAVQDRRSIRKKTCFESYEKEKADAVEEISVVDKELNSCKNEIDQLTERIRERTLAISKAERETRELELRIMQFRAVRRRNIAMVAQYPTIISDVLNKVESSNMDMIKQWNEFSGEQQKIYQSLIEQSTELNVNGQEMISALRLEYFDWKKLVKEEKDDSTAFRALALLIKGHRLRIKMSATGNPDIDEIKEMGKNIIERNKKVSQELIEIPEIDLEKMERKTLEAEARVESLKREIADLEKKLETCQEETSSARQSVEVSAAGLATLTANMADKLEKLRKLAEKHCALLSSQLPQKFSEQPEVASEENTERIPLEINSSEACCTQLADLSQSINDGVLISLENPRGKNLVRLLKASKGRLELSAQQIDVIKHLITLWKEQPFAKMVPKSKTLHGLTLTEWKYQLELDEIHLPVLRGDVSKFSQTLLHK